MPSDSDNRARIAVVGATGAVGRVTMALLRERGYASVRAFANSSGASRGRSRASATSSSIRSASRARKLALTTTVSLPALAVSTPPAGLSISLALLPWAGLAAYWLLSRPVQTALEWSWASYLRSELDELGITA